MTWALHLFHHRYIAYGLCARYDISTLQAMCQTLIFIIPRFCYSRAGMFTVTCFGICLTVTVSFILAYRLPLPSLLCLPLTAPGSLDPGPLDPGPGPWIQDPWIQDSWIQGAWIVAKSNAYRYRLP